MANFNKHSFIINEHTTLNKYFAKIGLKQSLLKELLKSSKLTKKLQNLKKNHTLTIVGGGGKFLNLEYQLNAKFSIKVWLIGDVFYSKKIIYHKPYIHKNKYNIKKTSILINRSFMYDAKKQGLSANKINKALIALNYIVNPKYLHKGDIFDIYWYRGRVDAIKLKRKNHNIMLFYWREKYYNKQGFTEKNMFLSAPLKYIRISSQYTNRRFHPILKKYKPHRAIDYAANKNERVYASANGIIEYSGYLGALGNVVFIRHHKNYKTVYAHLANFVKNLYAGQRVYQGELIGFVGSTGRSTGYHLHYELRRGNKYLNPNIQSKIKITASLSGSELVAFKQKIKRYGY